MFERPALRFGHPFRREPELLKQPLTRAEAQSSMPIMVPSSVVPRDHPMGPPPPLPLRALTPGGTPCHDSAPLGGESSRRHRHHPGPDSFGQEQFGGAQS